MPTDSFIRHLAGDSRPVRRLQPPWIRAIWWLALAIPYVALIVLVMSPRSDLLEKASDLRFVTEQGAAFATGIAAAIAAFTAVIPGYSRRFLFLPVLPVTIWLASLGKGCIEDWIRFGLDGLTLRPDFFCFPAILLVGLLPAMVMAVMLRRGAPLMPHMAAAMGGLAAAGLGNFGLRLFHPQDVSLMVLVWQFGTVCLLTAIAASGGRYVLNWRTIAGATSLPQAGRM